MRKSIAAMIACLALVCLGAFATAADNAQPGPLTGTWSCVSHGGQQGDMNFTLDLQQNGETVTGDVSSPLGDADLSSGAFKNNHLTITIDGGSDQYTLSATLKGGKLAGKWSTSDSGKSGVWDGKKAPAGSQ
ncbi:MAG: hypothetical protein ACRD18_13375 [Terriglobia bacterium]